MLVNTSAVPEVLTKIDGVLGAGSDSYRSLAQSYDNMVAHGYTEHEIADVLRASVTRYTIDSGVSVSTELMDAFHTLVPNAYGRIQQYLEQVPPYAGNRDKALKRLMQNNTEYVQLQHWLDESCGLLQHGHDNPLREVVKLQEFFNALVLSNIRKSPIRQGGSYMLDTTSDPCVAQSRLRDYIQLLASTPTSQDLFTEGQMERIVADLQAICFDG